MFAYRIAFLGGYGKMGVFLRFFLFFLNVVGVFFVCVCFFFYVLSVFEFGAGGDSFAGV